MRNASAFLLSRLGDEVVTLPRSQVSSPHLCVVSAHVSSYPQYPQYPQLRKMVCPLPIVGRWSQVGSCPRSGVVRGRAGDGSPPQPQLRATGSLTNGRGGLMQEREHTRLQSCNSCNVSAKIAVQTDLSRMSVSDCVEEGGQLLLARELAQLPFHFENGEEVSPFSE